MTFTLAKPIGVALALFATFATFATAAGSAALADDQRPPHVDAILEQAKQKARKIPLQAIALAQLAWPAGGPSDALVQAAARRELVDFGQHGLQALRQAIRNAGPLYQADVVAALIEARFRDPAGMPEDYLPALEEAIWFGSPEARRVALLELGHYAFLPGLVTAVDAAHEDPEITRVAIRTLGRMGDNRAHVFLREALTRGHAYYKPAVAAAIADLGGPAVHLLREALASPDAATRGAAMRELLPLTTLEDLSLLHEFAAAHPDDDPELLRAIRERVTSLEPELSVERDAEAPSAPTEGLDPE